VADDRQQRRAGNTGPARIDWRGSVWGTLCLLLLSSVLVFVFPAMSPLLRVILALALYLGVRYACRRYRRQR